MTKSRLIIGSVTLALASLSTHPQSTFENLDFELATLSPSSGSQFVSASAAIPYWTGYLGATPQTELLQNGQSHGGQSIDIFAPNYPAAGPQGSSPGIIDGD